MSAGMSTEAADVFAAMMADGEEPEEKAPENKEREL